MPTAATIRNAALAGAAGGLRSATPFGALALRGRLGDGTARAGALLAAAGELVADKLPIVPPRTSPPSLAGRLLSGAVAGGLIGGGAVGAAVGSAAAGVATFAGQRARSELGRRTGLPDLLIAVAEDALAIGVALTATRR